ncbi:uncharacterized protein PAC_01392 [Phialocephala subalpina]|uniref:Hsp70 protein n=1 Tax=Phialocephala subalpina TaxID=576137 RepID=A0A1L7WFH5_9HELO|nr:uncharacterized protein PAC_01392 [Phialocephala subalpina]
MNSGNKKGHRVVSSSTATTTKIDTQTTSSTIGTGSVSIFGLGSVQFSGISTNTPTLPFRHAGEQKKGHGGFADKLIIGIDFGTTYTGIAYAYASKPEEIRVIKEWEGDYTIGCNDFTKAPSLMKYTSAESNEYTWGYHINVNEPGVIRGIKLDLDPGRRDFYKKSGSAADATGNIAVQLEHTASIEQAHLYKTTVDIVSDYIRAAYTYALSQIRTQSIGGFVDGLKKEFAVTVPAIWSEEAKTSTLLAVRKAHIDFRVLSPADLITEPEAAALCVFHAFSKTGLKIGDTFLLCDAGGGTVDLVSYKVKATKPKLELEEIVEPSGGAVGSMMLNVAFDNYLKNALGDAQYEEFFKSDCYKYHEAMAKFESSMKPRFNGAQEWDEKAKRFGKISFGEVTIKDDPQKCISKGHLTVTGKTLFDIFDPLVTEIENLVTAQLNSVKAKGGASTKCIFLVGGFGASPYLQKRLKALAGESIDVIYPPDAWSAVVRGAVLSKIPNVISVVACVAARSYGVRANVVFHPHEHTLKAASHKYFDYFENTWRIPMMEWSVLKGEELDREKEWSVDFFRAIPLDYKDEDLLFECELEECDATFPSQYPWEGRPPSLSSLPALPSHSLDRPPVPPSFTHSNKLQVG